MLSKKYFFTLLLSMIFGISVFAMLTGWSTKILASFYSLEDTETIDETMFNGRIVKEALFSYSFVQNYNAATKKMDGVLKEIKDTNDGRILYDNMTYIAEKYTGQSPQKLYVKSLTAADYFIDNERQGDFATIAQRCALSSTFECTLLSATNFSTDIEYYVKMKDDKPFYINFCNQENFSFIPGIGCMKTHEFCANNTGMKQIVGNTGLTIPVSQQQCSCYEGMLHNAQTDTCVVEGKICANSGDTYNASTKICTKKVEVKVDGPYTCGTDNTIGRQHISFKYPSYIQSSELAVDGDYTLGFVSTGNRTNGAMYEWKGNLCEIDDSGSALFGKFVCGNSVSSSPFRNTSIPTAGSDVYLSLRAACGTTYGMGERSATLTITYKEVE